MNAIDREALIKRIDEMIKKLMATNATLMLSGFHYDGRVAPLTKLKNEIQSGAFDAEQMKNFEDFLQNYEDFQRKYEHYQTEVQHLRAAIKKAISMWQNTCDFADPEDVIEKMIAYLNEALSGAREKEEPNHD